MTCFSGSINATTMVRVNGHDSKAFGVWVGVHHGSVLTQLYVTVLKANELEHKLTN